MTIREFSIKIPQANLGDLQRRLAAARWPEELDGAGWTYGMPETFVKDVRDFFTSLKR
jgi:hypothetical protein